MDLKNCFPIYETFKTKADAFPKLTIEQKKQTILDINNNSTGERNPLHDYSSFCLS